MPDNNLYFIAIIPPQAICQEVTVFKKDIALHYNSKRALRIMPHITLKAPFTIPSTRDGEVLHWFTALTTQVQPFPISLDGFDAFANPKNPVIFVKPVPSTPLFLLQKDILFSFRKFFGGISIHPVENRFHPHMTIAYRDLAQEAFTHAWQVYRTKMYKATFTIDGYFLLKHNGDQWEIVARNNL